jgi:hypothetical protein
MKFIGQQFSFGIGKESVRGTGVSAQYSMPWSSLSIDDKIQSATDETSIGVIEKGVGSDIAVFTSECTVEGNMDDAGFGLLLKALMGAETVSAVAGESAVKDHKFTVAQNAQHPSLSLSVYGPNESSGLVYPLGMIDTLDLDIELDKYATYKTTIKANKSASQGFTPSFTAVNKFRPQDGAFTYAANLSGLSGGTALSIHKLSLSFKKNTEDDVVIGNQNPVDRYNKGFELSGSFELNYDSRTLIDSEMLGDAYIAFQIVMTNSAVSIGTSSHPTFTLRVAKAKITEIARKLDSKNITTMTVKFTPFYSISDTEMVDLTLRNSITSAY